MAEPTFLHKYRALDGENLQFVRQSIISKTLWLSRPSAFNDPFDCAPVVDTSWERSGWDFTARRLAEKRARGLPRFQKRALRRETLQKTNRLGRISRSDANDIAVSVMSDIRDKMGVLSLSGDPSNILMWSHYAHSHTGLVLTFRTDNDDIISEAQRVIYSNERPVVDVVGDRENVMVKTLLRKADYWSYELEWRAIRTGRPGHHGFSPDSLSAIIFGARTSPEVKRSIRQAVDISGLHVRFGQAKFDERLFQLNIVPAE